MTRARTVTALALLTATLAAPARADCDGTHTVEACAEVTTDRQPDDLHHSESVTVTVLGTPTGTSNSGSVPCTGSQVGGAVCAAHDLLP